MSFRQQNAPEGRLSHLVALLLLLLACVTRSGVSLCVTCVRRLLVLYTSEFSQHTFTLTTMRRCSYPACCMPTRSAVVLLQCRDDANLQMTSAPAA